MNLKVIQRLSTYRSLVCTRDGCCFGMRRVKPYIIFTVCLVFVTWNLLTYYMLVSRPTTTLTTRGIDHIQNKLDRLQAEIQLHLESNNQLLFEINKFKHKTNVQEQARILTEKYNLKKSRDLQQKQADISQKVSLKKTGVLTTSATTKVVIPVLVIACDRETVSKCLDLLIRYRPSQAQFPIIVSQDCGHAKTSQVISSYRDKVTHIKHPDISDIALPWPSRKFKGYYKISRHYKWALSQVFKVFNYTSVIVVEDDLSISQDFFEYFAATHPLLHTDPSLWCVSAWNDNGKHSLIQDKSDLLYRTDFFPGLGWMLKRDTWLELEPKWPKTFWDDWMRHPDQRKNRACIRPEICRTSTFGKIGVSKGQFFEKHLKFIKLNEKYVPFTKQDLSYLLKENYDLKFIEWVYSSPLLSPSEVLEGSRPEEESVRVQYSSEVEFVKLAKALGIMEDMKAGVPRAGYRGVATLMYKNRRVFVAPPSDWKTYDPSWN